MIHSIYFECIQSFEKKEIIWGDKTPANTVFGKLIKKQFLESKIIFLLRDVMSSLLDVNKSYYLKKFNFMVWRWKNSIHKFETLKHQYPQDILLVKYENFVHQPIRTINEILQFINLKPNAEMLIQNKRNLESLGVQNAKSHQNIKNAISTKSIGKWNTRLDLPLSTKIEQLLKKELIKYHYI